MPDSTVVLKLHEDRHRFKPSKFHQFYRPRNSCLPWLAVAQASGPGREGDREVCTFSTGTAGKCLHTLGLGFRVIDFIDHLGERKFLFQLLSRVADSNPTGHTTCRRLLEFACIVRASRLPW